jgi:regulator of replication initiation timing
MIFDHLELRQQIHDLTDQVAALKEENAALEAANVELDEALANSERNVAYLDARLQLEKVAPR